MHISLCIPNFFSYSIYDWSSGYEFFCLFALIVENSFAEYNSAETPKNMYSIQQSMETFLKQTTSWDTKQILLNSEKS